MKIWSGFQYITVHSYNCALWGLHIADCNLPWIITLQHFTVVFMYLQPLSTQGRHGSISTDNREAWQWVSLWQQEVSMVVSRSHLDCPYDTQTRLTSEKQQSPNSACPRVSKIHVFNVINKLWGSWSGSVRERAIVTCSKLHVHHWFSDDGQESVSEGVSAPFPMKTLEQSWHIYSKQAYFTKCHVLFSYHLFLVFRSVMYLLGLKLPI